MPTPDRTDPTPAPSATASPAPARTAAMRFIMSTVLIDMVSIGLIVPVLPLLIGNFTTNPTEQALWYGVVAFAYSAANFFGAPILGGLSDRFGRRPVLLLGFCGLALNFFATALATQLWVLIAVRLMGGLMQANAAVANAYVADISAPEERAKRFGMLGAMFGLTAYRIVPLPFAALFICGALFAGIMAVVIELGVYRTLRVRRIPLVNIVISTIAMSILLQNGAHLLWGSEPMAYPKLFTSDFYFLGPVKLAPQLIWIVVLAIGMMLALQLFLRFTRAGLAMQAVAQDAEAAQLMGINLTRATAATYGIAGLLGGAAGVLLGSMFYASFNMGFLPGIKAFVAATLGGLGSIGGAMLGGVVFGLIETVTATSITSAYKDAVGMVLLILILLVLPQGFAGAFRRGR